MNISLTKEQISRFRTDGFVIQENFLNEEELAEWREAVAEAVKNRNGLKMPGRDIMKDDDDGNNEDPEYFSNVFDQLLNLWQTNDRVKKLMLDHRIGKMASELAGVDGIRVWHDQALIKRPWANPTAWHLDTPFWSFSDRNALSIWIALDDATVENGCLYFIPGSHQKTTFENPGITKNMNAVFQFYPELAKMKPFCAEMKAGSASFHNGLCIHGAGPNMTPGFRRAMTCAFMPDGAVFNGIQNILTDEIFKRLNIGEVMNDNDQNPLIYSASQVKT
ncbi:phytanoyl-CoA dioxygenase family protein [Echinicola shivajiensis]|uniref:phytanoyl-CoA dioxygenase family protein n=1 Tax=Echinicola shivajiensis TaxID=1035916 RepID=UPI001BFC1CF8|nr:phytanoyl-CoA dioxygenase family protein [Echinicola shivajiensis]